jgi:hypothetical protein
MERHDLLGLGVSRPLLIRGRREGGLVFGGCPVLRVHGDLLGPRGGPELVDANTAIAAAIAPRNTKRDVEIIEFSCPLNGFGARQRRPSNDAALEMFHVR